MLPALDFFLANLLHPPSVLDTLSKEMLLLTHSSSDTTELKSERAALLQGLMMPQTFQRRYSENTGQNTVLCPDCA